MSDFSQNSFPGTVAQDARPEALLYDEQGYADEARPETQGEFLAGFDEQDESEFGLLAAAHKRVSTILDKAADPSNCPAVEVLQNLASIQTSIEQLTLGLRQSGRAAGLLIQSEVDGTFRTDPNSVYGRTSAILLDFVDSYTAQWGYGNRTSSSYRTDQHRAGDAAVTQILALLSESYDHVYVELPNSGPVVTPEMNVTGEVQTDRVELAGQIARIVHLCFIHQSGQQARAADVHVYSL